MRAAVARSCFCSIIQQLFILEISTSSMMENQLKSTLAVAVQMVTPFRKPCDLVSLRVSVIVS